MTSPVQALARIRWRSAEQGGRFSGPPPGPQYFATAVFVLGGDAEVDPGWPATGEHFGVALLLAEPGPDGGVVAELRFLAPELAGAYLAPGAELLLMEGPRAIGEATILTLETVPEVN